MKHYAACILSASLILTVPAYAAQTLLGVDSYQQTKDWTCGPSVSLTVLQYWQRKDTEDNLAAAMGTSEDTGTRPEGMVKYFSEHGFDVTWGTDGTLDMLKDSVAKGVPVLVEWIDWGGHWVAVVGFDNKDTEESADDEILLADPYDRVDGKLDGLVRFNADRFDSMWFDALYFKEGKGITKGVWIRPVPKPKTDG